MVPENFQSPLPFITKKRKNHLEIIALDEKGLSAFLKKQDTYTKTCIENSDFKGKPGNILWLNNPKSGAYSAVLFGVSDKFGPFESCALVESVISKLPAEKIEDFSFEISAEFSALSALNIVHFHIGWGWGCYKFDFYKEKKVKLPGLLWSKGVDKTRISAHTEAVNTLRNLVNTPSNDCGPDELESFTKILAERFGADVKTIHDKALLTKNFPLIHTVGRASPRRPRLIELNWGKKDDPKITLVGKGVCFDTGGLDIKPSAFMRHMKKDMGGAAHALNVAFLIMALNLPVRLRVLVAAVENSISGDAFRPGDIIKSRKGLTVENTNTDAEGRLILADALTYACEDSPELIIDFATLTGSARAGLGPDIPSMFSNNDDLAARLQKLSIENEDPVWNMPLWRAYNKHNKSGVADLQNSAGIPGDAIYSALFLKSFLLEKNGKTPDWIHLDCYAWEQTGRAGRPVGAADTGMRAVFALLEERYGSKKPIKSVKSKKSK
jgi:leucyl aminopeptidase